MNDTVSFFLPTRKGSERVKNKNTKKFCDISGGLLELKISQLLKVQGINEIIISTNDPETEEIANSFKSESIKIIQRPEELCTSSTRMDDFIKYIPTIINSNHIFWVHTTSPFMNELDYLKYLNSYLEDVDSGLYDSYISVNKVQTFLYDLENKQFISHNYEEYKWPRSQDLKSFYELNHAFYILPTEVMRSVNDRMGRKPRFIQLSKEKSFDIDWEEDFKMAEYIYNNL